MCNCACPAVPAHEHNLFPNLYSAQIFNNIQDHVYTYGLLSYSEAYIFAVFRYFHMAVTVRNNIKNKNKAELYDTDRDGNELITMEIIVLNQTVEIIV